MRKCEKKKKKNKKLERTFFFAFSFLFCREAGRELFSRWRFSFFLLTAILQSTPVYGGTALATSPETRRVYLCHLRFSLLRVLRAEPCQTRLLSVFIASTKQASVRVAVLRYQKKKIERSFVLQSLCCTHKKKITDYFK